MVYVCMYGFYGAYNCSGLVRQVSESVNDRLWRKTDNSTDPRESVAEFCQLAYFVMSGAPDVIMINCHDRSSKVAVSIAMSCGASSRRMYEKR